MASHPRRNARHRREQAPAPAAEPAVRSSPHPALPTATPPDPILIRAGELPRAGDPVLRRGARRDVVQQAAAGRARPRPRPRRRRAVPPPPHHTHTHTPCGATTRCFGRGPSQAPMSAAARTVTGTGTMSLTPTATATAAQRQTPRMSSPPHPTPALDPPADLWPGRLRWPRWLGSSHGHGHDEPDAHGHSHGSAEADAEDEQSAPPNPCTRSTC